MGGGFGPACCCIRAVCRWLVLNDRLWDAALSSGEVKGCGDRIPGHRLW